MQLGIERIVGQPEWEFAAACLQAIGAGFGVLAYSFVVAPLTTIIFEGRALRYKVQGYAVAIVQTLLSRVFERAFVVDVVSPEVVDSAENAIVLSNHQGLLDYLVLLHLSDQLSIDQSCFFYVWKHCVRLPSLRSLWNEWQKRADWQVPNQNLQDTLMPVLETPYRGRGGKWIVIFPEVTPWSVPDMLQHRVECTRRGGRPLDHLLYPRFPAFVQTTQFLRDLPLGAVYDVTITYVNRREANRVGVPTWLELLLSNKDWRIHIVITRTPIAAVPKRETQLVRWLEKLWYAKDRRLGEYMAALETPAAPRAQD